MKRALLALTFVLTLLVVLPPTFSSPVIAQPSGITFVARLGEPLAPPFPGGSAIDDLSPPDVNDGGDASFYVRGTMTGPPQCGVMSGDGTSRAAYFCDTLASPDGPLFFCGQLTARPLTNTGGAIA